jgi:hypothetical protein
MQLVQSPLDFLLELGQLLREVLGVVTERARAATELIGLFSQRVLFRAYALRFHFAWHRVTANINLPPGKASRPSNVTPSP